MELIIRKRKENAVVNETTFRSMTHPLAETMFRSIVVRLEAVFGKRWSIFLHAVLTEENKSQLSVWRNAIDIILLKEIKASHLFLFCRIGK